MQIPHRGFIEADSNPPQPQDYIPSIVTRRPLIASMSFPRLALRRTSLSCRRRRRRRTGGERETKAEEGRGEGGEGEGEDPELASTKAEIEALRVKKEREKRLLDVEAGS